LYITKLVKVNSQDCLSVLHVTFSAISQSLLVQFAFCSWFELWQCFTVA